MEQPDESQGGALRPVGIWTSTLDFAPTAHAMELAHEVEELGYGAVWLPEFAGRDLFVHLAMLLSSTSSLVGATGIANIYARDAIAMTGAAKALAETYPGRIILGLGVSHKDIVSGFRGHVYERPIEKMTGYLEAMNSAPFGGHRPSIPNRRVIAALGPRMLDVARENADGAHTFLVPPEHTMFAREVLGPDALLCPEQGVVLHSDLDRATEIARSHVASYISAPSYARNLLRLGFEETDFADGGSDRLVHRLIACGDVAAIAKRVEEHLLAGADHVALNVLHEERRGIPTSAWRELAPAMTEVADRYSVIA
jgi:probable F420-dependent oxidoreductase